MKKILAFCFLHLAISISAQTQKVESRIGTEYNSNRNEAGIFLGSDESGYFMIHSIHDKGQIQHYNKNMIPDRSVTYDHPKLPGIKLEYDSCIEVGNNFCLFYTGFDLKLQAFKLYAQRLNKSTLQITGELIELSSVVFEYKRSFEEYRYSNSEGYLNSKKAFYMFLSEEGNTFLVISKKRHQESQDGHTFLTMCYSSFDKDLNKMWSQEINTNKIITCFKFSDVTFEENGDISMIVIEYDSLFRQRAGLKIKRSYRHYLFRISQLGTKQTKREILLNDKFIISLISDKSNDGDFILSGFYSEKGSFNSKGAFYLRINSLTDEITTQKLTAFDADFIKLNMTKKELKRNRKREAEGKELEMEDYFMRRLLINEDSGIILIAEQYEYYYSLSNAGGQDWHYEYNNIIVISFDVHGNIKWKNIIAKSQHTWTGKYSSFFLCSNSKNLFFIFNQDITPSHYLPRNIKIALVTISESGAMTKQPLFSSELGPEYSMLRWAYQTDFNEMVINKDGSNHYQYRQLIFSD